MNKALRHEEPDRVPISDFFWGGFTRRWRKELGLPADANPYYHYDLDWIVTVPNMDPWIRPFETLKETAEEVVVKTGFGAIMHKHFEFPMPEMRGVGDRHVREAGAGRVRRPARPAALLRRRRQPDRRRGRRFRAQLAAVDRDGEVAAARLPGLWQHDRGERMPHPAHRPGRTRCCGWANTRSAWARSSTASARIYLEMAKAEIEAGAGLLDGFVIWGDVAYKKGTFMSPAYWREYFKPWVAQMAEHAHAARSAGDLPRLRQREGDLPGLHRHGHRRLQSARSQGGHGRGGAAPRATATASASAATATCRCGKPATATPSGAKCCASSTPRKGGGYIFQSDHSVSSAVSGPHLRLHREAGARIRPVSAPARRIRSGRLNQDGNPKSK